MCGIAGIYAKHNKEHITRLNVELLTDQLYHRGPDAGAVYMADGIGMGHRRLAITDPSSNADQPMHSANQRYTIVFNGQVYNYRDIRARLLREKPSLHFRTDSDTEVVLESFVHWGAEAVYQWNGMFSIGIWDRAEQALWLFRDRMGEKPIYYFWNGSDFAFASELKSLEELPFFSKEPSEHSIQQFLHLGYIPEPATIYKHIYKAEKGTYLCINDKGLHINRYWDLERQIKPIIFSSQANVLVDLEELVTSSVLMRMPQDKPYGIMLSGGIDSSLITAVAQAHAQHAIPTFSIGFEDDQYNESAFARKVANYLGTDHTEMIISERDAADEMPKLIDAFDEPFSDSSAIAVLLISKLASKDVSVLLCGEGGDELFHGYGRHLWAQRLQRQEVWMGRHLASAILRPAGQRYAKAARILAAPDRAGLRSHIFSQEQLLFSETELRRHYKRYTGPDTSINAASTFDRRLSPAEEQALFDLQYYLPGDLLVKLDRCSMQYSMESRCPLLDHRLVNYALNIDPALKMAGGVHKHILKELLYSKVPEHFFNRPKWGFSIPLEKWLKGPLGNILYDYLSPEKVRRFGWFSPSYVSNMLYRFHNNGASHLYNRLWVMALLHKWADKHI